MKKKTSALLLTLVLCFSLFPTAFADGKTYDEAVKELQSDAYYETEQSFDSDYGTVFIYSLGTNPHGAHGFLSFITKAPCAKGEGEVIGLPHARNSLWCHTKPPHTAELSEDGETFTYTYHYDEPILSMWDVMLRPAGDFIYTLDLTTGEVTSQEPSIPEDYNTYPAAMERVKNEEGWVIERTLETPDCTVLLRYFQAGDGRRSYFLDCVYKVAQQSYREGMVVSHNLTITKDDGTGEAGFPVYYTHRAPDSLTLSEDKSHLTFSYSESLAGGSQTETLRLGNGIPTAPQPQALAEKLKALGLFLGDENGNFNLEKVPTRTEALVMLIRALGEDSQARAAGKTHPFTDVPAWADGYVSWGYARGYTKGMSATEFGAESSASCEMYLTFLLRALGYTEGLEGDFTYDKPYYLAYQAGIFPADIQFYNFRRSDVVKATAAALFANQKDSDFPLWSELTDKKVFSGSDFQTQFPGDPYAYEKSLEPLVDKACAYYFEEGRQGNDVKTQANLILHQHTSEDITTVYALVCTVTATLLPDGGNTGTYKYYGMGLRFSPETRELLERRELPYDDPIWTDASMRPLLEGNLDKAAWEPIFSAAYAPGSYADAVAELRSGTGHRNEQTFETDDCTVFVFDRGGFMNAPAGMMVAIYKAGSALEEGYTLELPHVRNGMSLTPADSIAFDPEKGTFTYSYFFDTTAYDSSIKSYDTRVEPGTFTFTVDLATGEVQREYRPIDYAGAMAHVTRKRIHSLNEHSRDREVVQTLETDLCTVVLTNGGFVSYDDYALSLVYTPGSPLGDGAIKQLILPSTVYDKVHAWYKPTDRAPDTLEISDGGKTLTYVYRFDEALITGSGVYHDAGTYTYTVDLATGELSVTHTEQ